MTDVAGDLPDLDEKVEGSHPLFCAQARLAGKVVHMCHEPLHEILHARIAALGIDGDGVGSDVVNIEVLEDGRYVLGCHGDEL